MTPIVLFGTGAIADVVADYLVRARGAEALAGYVVDAAYWTTDTHKDRPVVRWDDLTTRFAPQNHDAFVALGYQELNQIRLDRITALHELGYETPPLIDAAAFIADSADIGPNALVLDHASVEPYAQVGMGAFIWSNATLGHHSTVEDGAWMTANVAVGGHSRIGARSFLGLGAAIGNQVELGEACFVGAGARVTKSAPAKTVIVEPDTPRHRLDSDAFMRLTRLR